MSGANKSPAKRSHQKNLFAFPNDLEIPESALSDRKFRSSYVRIFNDPRVYKRPRLNGDRTSSRFDVDQNYQIKVVFSEPVVKLKSSLASTQSPKNDSGICKSVSFSSKITFIDAIDLDGGSSDSTDVEIDDKRSNKSKKTKALKNGKPEMKTKKAAASNDKPSSKNKKKTKDKSSNKNGHKVKPTQKELFKFKITKPFRKFGRSKDKKLKHLQKKFGRRMFKAFVQVKRSFNLKTIPEQVTVPLERITLNTNDVTTPKKSVPSIQDFLIGRMTKKVKVSLTPVQVDTGSGTDEPMTIDTEIIPTKASESNSSENVEDSSRTLNDVQSDYPVDRQEMAENSETNQNASAVPSTESSDSAQLDPSGTSIQSKVRPEMAENSETNQNASAVPSTESSDSDQLDPSGTSIQSKDRQEMAENSETNQNASAVPSTESSDSDQLDQNGPSIQSNGDVVPAETDGSPDVNIDKCNDTDPSPEVVEFSALPNLIDEITCSMYYNTNNDETVTINGQMLGSDADDHHDDGNLDENISTFNVSFTMPTKSLTDNMLGCDSPEIASIQLEMND